MCAMKEGKSGSKVGEKVGGKVGVFCNPILDIVVPCGEEAWYKKWQVLPGTYQEYDAEKHDGIYTSMLEHPDCQTLPGGSGQNTAAIVASLLRELSPKVPGTGGADPETQTDGTDGTAAVLPTVTDVEFFGCVGANKERGQGNSSSGSVSELDGYGAIMKKAAEERGLKVRYAVTEEASTGRCALAIDRVTRERVMVTSLGATAFYTREHIARDAAMGKEHRIVHVTGFFVTATAEGMVELCKSVGKSEPNTILSVCFSAPFVVQFYTEPVWQCIQEADIISGNDSEWDAAITAYAARLGFPEGTLPEREVFMVRLAEHTKALCICTCGDQDTLVCNPLEDEPLEEDEEEKEKEAGNAGKEAGKDGKEAGKASDEDLPPLIPSVRRFPVTKVPKELIQDTNGCGDAFIGGVLTAIALGADWRAEPPKTFQSDHAARLSPLQNLVKMITLGHTCARDCLGRLAFNYDSKILSQEAKTLFSLS